MAAAARLFNLAANDPSTKIEFVTADGAALPESESGSEGGAMSEDDVKRQITQSWVDYWFIEKASAASGIERSHRPFDDRAREPHGFR